MGYSKPGLRKRIVAEVKASNKGGRPGQWSARKAQIAADRYEKAGGGYSGPKTTAQLELSSVPILTAVDARCNDGTCAMLLRVVLAPGRSTSW